MISQAFKTFIGALLLSLHCLCVAAEPTSRSSIVVGQIGPFSVLPAPDPVELNEGIKAAFAEINAKGGVKGREVLLTTLDDGYSYEGFRRQLEKLMSSKPLALLSPLGSGALKGMLDDKLLDTNDLIVINAVPGAQVLREPGHQMFFHIRAGDEQQISKIVLHARSMTLGTMGVLYQSIPMGTSGLASAKQAAREVGGMEISGFASDATKEALNQAAQALAKQKLQSALIIGAPKFSGDAVAALRAAGVSQQIFALSYLSPRTLVKLAGQQGAHGVGIVQAFPNPNGIRLPLQRNFKAAMTKSFPNLKEYTSFHIEGYVTALVFAEAARRSKELTPKAIAAAMRGMGKLDLGGFRVDFTSSNSGSNWLDIGVVLKDGRLRY